MATLYPDNSQIESAINSAQSGDTIYLPNEEINYSIAVDNDNDITIQGQEKTIIDCKGEEDYCLKIDSESSIDLINIRLKNLKTELINDETITTKKDGLVLERFSGLVSRLEISDCKRGILLRNSSKASFEEIKVTECETGIKIKDSQDIEFSITDIFLCTTGFDIQGSSDIVGDVFNSQSLGLNFSNIMDLSGLSRRKDEIKLSDEPATLLDFVDKLNNKLEETGEWVEIYAGDEDEDEKRSIGVRLKTTDDNEKIILAENTLLGWKNGEYSDYHIREEKKISLDEILDKIENDGSFDVIIEIDRIFTYTININENEFSFNCKTDSTYGEFVNTLKNAENTNNEKFKLYFKPEIIEVNDDELDIRIASNDESPINLELNNNEWLQYLTRFTKLPPQKDSRKETERDDRTHHMIFKASQSHENTLGINIVNSNHLEFDNFLVYSNEVGIIQNAESYSNNFVGEVYDNKDYGVRNTDKRHDFIARQTWWGDITGPSMVGPGNGDKVSSHVVFDAWRQDGNEPEQSYPATRDWVWRMLGYPLVRVELSEEHISDAIDMAIDRYEEFRNPEQTYYYLPVSVGQDLVELPAWMSKKEVMDVVYSPHSDLFSQLTGAGESFYLTYYLQNTGGTFLSDFYVAMAYKETLELTLGIGPQYELFTQKNKEGEWRDYIRLSPKPSVSLQIGVLYNRPMTEEEVDSSTWIRKYALTWAKEQLGRIRSKFASVPGPTGEMQLDGQQLITEAQQERESLDQSVIQRGPPLTFDIG